MDMPARRIGAEGSATRALLLDAAEKLVVEEGYAAVTTRHLALRAGLKPQLVHYYFRTMDDLFREMYKRVVDRALVRLENALKKENPVRALWKFTSDPRGGVLAIELWALANHRKSFRTEMVRANIRFREIEVKYLSRFFKERGIDSKVLPLVVAVLGLSVSRLLVAEKFVGVKKGHTETMAFVEKCLRLFETADGPQKLSFLSSAAPAVGRAGTRKKARSAK
jgi:AcrR family transcriptional regulator